MNTVEATQQQQNDFSVVNLRGFLTALWRGEPDDAWPLVFLSPAERTRVQAVAKYLLELRVAVECLPGVRAIAESLRRIPEFTSNPDLFVCNGKALLETLDKLPSQEQLESELKAAIEELSSWYDEVRARGKEAISLIAESKLRIRSLDNGLAELAKREQTLAVRDSELTGQESTAAEREVRLRYEEANLAERKANLSVEEERLAAQWRGLESRQKAQAEVAKAQKEADRWWHDLELRVGTCVPPATPRPPAADECTPTAQERAQIVSNLTSQLREAVNFPEEIGILRLEGGFYRTLRAVGFKAWPTPHVLLEWSLVFEGKAYIGALRDTALKFGRTYLGWHAGTPAGVAQVCVTVELGHKLIPLCVLDALSSERLSATGAALTSADQGSVTFSVRGWDQPVVLSRPLLHWLVEIVAPSSDGGDMVDRLIVRGVLDDTLLADILRGAMRATNSSANDAARVSGLSAAPMEPDGVLTPVASCVLSLLEGSDQWKGTPAQLLQAVLEQAQPLGISAAALPASPSALSRCLAGVLPPTLVTVEHRRTAKMRSVVLRRCHRRQSTVE